VELEFHQLELRYERLRVQQPARERRLLASLAMAGQQMPIVVVTGGAAYVVVDGHKRVRCLRRLQRDTIAAVVWEMPEPEALIFRQLLRTDATDSAFEQGWLLRTLHDDHGLALDALARRFDRSVSWVSRRLSLVRTLPEAVQQHVQDGRLVPHAAMKYFVPVARANAADCLRLVEAIAPHRLSTRQIGRLYQVYLTGPDATRELVLTDPAARAARHRRDPAGARATGCLHARGAAHRPAHSRRRRAPRRAPSPTRRRPAAAGAHARLAALRSGRDGLSRSTATV
jgi:ParB family transcriptional regulator, chromosome partitioning protein